ncbi:hypothetical protein BC628DRAFT_970417 [Trametes gibbosa]|nr:hypothetical protein BC628DRAFT_970417 [Trametes gibbosa]
MSQCLIISKVLNRIIRIFAPALQAMLRTRLRCRRHPSCRLWAVPHVPRREPCHRSSCPCPALFDITAAEARLYPAILGAWRNIHRVLCRPRRPVELDRDKFELARLPACQQPRDAREDTGSTYSLLGVNTLGWCLQCSQPFDSVDAQWDSSAGTVGWAAGQPPGRGVRSEVIRWAYHV